MFHVEKQRQIVEDYDIPEQEIMRVSKEYQSHSYSIDSATLLCSYHIHNLGTMIKSSKRFRDMYRSRQVYRTEEGTEPKLVDVIDQSAGTRKPANETERYITGLLKTHDDDRAREGVFKGFTILEELARRLDGSMVSSAVLDTLNQLVAVRFLSFCFSRGWAMDALAWSDCTVDFQRPREDIISRITAIPYDEKSDLAGAFRKIMTTTSSDGSEKIAPLSKHLDHTTNPKARPNERIKAIQAEDNLRQFWEDAEGILMATKAVSDDILDVIKDVTPLNAYPETRDPAANTKSTTTPAPAAVPAAPFVPLPAAAPGDYVAKKVPRKLVELQEEARKREFQATVVEQQEPEDAPVPEDGQEWPRIELGPEHYATVDLLLGTSTVARPGEISWNDFTNLMLAIGFEGPQRHAGSARSFVPSAELRATQVSIHDRSDANHVTTIIVLCNDRMLILLPVQGVTQQAGVHQPHQGGWPTVVARNWARNRKYGLGKYGWDIDHFVKLDA